MGTSRIEARRDRRKEEILRSAAKAFRKRGFHGTSTDEIAGALGMTKGNLYYYFRDKEQLLYSCHDHSLNLMLEALQQARGSRNRPEEKLRTLIRKHVEVMIDELGGSAMALDFGSLSPALLKRVIAKRDRYEQGFRQIIAEGAGSGAFAARDPKLAALAILGSINWMARWFRPEGRYSAGEIGEAFADFFVRGLSAPAGGGREAVSGRLRTGRRTRA